MPMSANIQGLNIVQPHQSSSDSQDLLSAQAFPDISAQLDLWTHLAFDTDETSLSHQGDDKFQSKNKEEGEDDTKSPKIQNGVKVVDGGQDNVAVATNIDSSTLNNASQPANQSSGLPHPPPFDLNTFLSGFGVDPYGNLSQHAGANPMAPSLAQLLAIHSHTQQFPTPIPNPFPHYQTDQSGPSYTPLPHILAPQAPPSLALAPTPSSTTAPASPADETSSKRARARKSSVSSEAFSPDTPTTSLAAAEDKRRRNTAASARFRLKKKEREAALEGKAKELEARVSELERECEGLRRENGWLKGLVVGVTGAAQAPVVTSSPPSLSPAQLANLTSTTASVKRTREDLDG